MTNLTAREEAFLVTVVKFGVDVNGSKCAEDLIQDNMTWFDLTDLAKAMKVKDAEFGKWAQGMGSVQASLGRKGLVADSGEPMTGRNRRYFAWYATEAGIRAVADAVWGAADPAAEEQAQYRDVSDRDYNARLALDAHHRRMAEAAAAEAKRLERNRKARERRAAKKA